MALDQDAESKILKRLAISQTFFLDDILFAMCQGDIDTLLLLLDNPENDEYNDEIGLLLLGLHELIDRMKTDFDNQHNLLTRKPLIKLPRSR